MAILDISPVFRPGMPGWPDDTPFDVRRTWTIGGDCPVNVSRIVLSSHTGSHADAPLHYRNDGRDIADLPLEPFIGACHVVDARGTTGPVILAEDILPHLPERVERVLFRQYDRQPDRWDPGLKGLDPALIDSLAGRGARLIGVDAASVDPAGSKRLDAHRRLDAHGIAILEGLRLDAVLAGDYELIALPMRIAGSDGAPVRAVLRPLPRYNGG